MTNFTMLVCNRPKLTKQALESLEGTPGIKVTISEDRKSDLETSQIITVFQRLLPECVVLGHTADYGTGALRNQVIAASEKYHGRGDYLYLSDNDVCFEPNWLKRLIHAYEAAQPWRVKVLGAYNHPYHIPSSECVHILDPVSRTMVYKVHSVEALALQSMLMTWEVWDKYGPFNDTPPGRVCMGEDVLFGNRIKEDGGKLGVISPPLMVNTGITNSFGDPIPGAELVKAQCPEGVFCE